LRYGRKPFLGPTKTILLVPGLSDKLKNMRSLFDPLSPFKQVRGMSWIIWALLSALFAGITAILAKIGVSGMDSNLATAVRTTVILVFTWAIALATNRLDVLRTVSGRTWVFLTLSGIATGLSWLCYFRALQLGNASQVAPVDKLSVVFVIALAALILGEQITWQHFVGGSLIVAGAVILAWGAS
jgi:bacterial/archaeal transporter family protein